MPSFGMGRCPHKLNPGTAVYGCMELRVAPKIMSEPNPKRRRRLRLTETMKKEGSLGCFTFSTKKKEGSLGCS